jgi:hypothetical protein
MKIHFNCSWANVCINHSLYKCIYIFVSPCVGGSKAPPRTLYRIKCVLAEQFIQTANYCNFLTSCSNCLHKCKASDGIPRWHKLHKSCLIRYVYDIKRSPSGLTLYIVYVPSRHDLSNTYIYIHFSNVIIMFYNTEVIQLWPQHYPSHVALSYYTEHYLIAIGDSCVSCARYKGPLSPQSNPAEEVVGSIDTHPSGGLPLSGAAPPKGALPSAL